MGTLGNIADPDEMPHNVAFHQGQHCLLRQNQFSEKEMQHFSEFITCDPSVLYWTILTYLTVSNFMESTITT